MHHTFRDHEYITFGLHGFTGKACSCGDQECASAGKHPRSKSWQHTPLWSDQQWEIALESGQYDSGYGILINGLLVIDVDARNGGVQAFDRLVAAIPAIASAGLIVESGSGGGSRHFYFKCPAGLALRKNLEQYPGIDFKSSGFVVGPGSLHCSGRKYVAVVGSVGDIDMAPQALLDLLARPDLYRGDINGISIDVSDDTLHELLQYVDASAADYDQYIKIGMALHHVTGGAGFDHWDSWAKRSDKYTGLNIRRRWESFGSASHPVTLGTLYHYAERGGYTDSVTFESDIQWLPEPPITAGGGSSVAGGVVDVSSIDLLRPPGFVGELVDFINSQCIFPRENLAVAGALMVVSCVAGMRYIDDLDATTPNVFLFCVAGSSSGKESVLTTTSTLLRAAGVSAAIYGSIKSEQEIYRNLLRHQAAFYIVDEMGEHLSKIHHAMQRGGATYLEGVVGTLMSVYSKAASFVLITGDLKEEVRKQLNQEASTAQKRIDENEDQQGKHAKHLERVTDALEVLDLGIQHPYLSMFGVTSPDKFEALVDHEMAVNGFLGRSMFFRELEDNPRRKPRAHLNREVPLDLTATLRSLYSPGESEISGRVESAGDKITIQTRTDAAALLDQISDEFWQQAETHKESTGLTAIPRRGYEHVAKLSCVLAIPTGIRTVEHVRWAYACVQRDLRDKLALCQANDVTAPADALRARILSLVTSEHGETVGKICNKCRKYDKIVVKSMLDSMVADGALMLGIVRGSGTRAGRDTSLYYRNI